MQKPRFEVTRFHAQDVIATSGGGEAIGNPVQNEVMYLTTLSEMKQYQESFSTTLPWVSFYLRNDKIRGTTGLDAAGVEYNKKQHYKYAWYNSANQAWYTQDIEIFDYSEFPDDGNSLPH